VKERILLLRWLAKLLSGYAYMYSDEKQLHDAIALALDQEGISYEREHIADSSNRFDFLVEGDLVIEIKVQGSLADALRQVTRYCGLEKVKAVLVAATCAWARQVSLDDINGKPVAIAYLRRQAL